MSLEKSVEILLGRPPTIDERDTLTELQNLHHIGDDDPLVIVLAMMARSQLLFQVLPDILQQKALETIELHRTTLREQSVLISKELITTVAENIHSLNMVSVKTMWFRFAISFLGGMITTGVVAWVIKLITR